jgi:hypothetical protein
MASENKIKDVVKEHIGREVTLCDTEGLICRDYICACFGSQCISGLLIQLAADNGNVTKEASGACGQTFYIRACYPLVVTDGCCILTATSTLRASDNDAVRLLGDVTTAAVEIGYREKLQRRVGDTSGYSLSIVQTCCAPCFCLPCHNAAIVRKLRPPANGKIWCPPKSLVVNQPF